MKNKLVLGIAVSTLISAFICFLPLVVAVLGEIEDPSFQYESYHVDATLLKNGDMQIVETIDTYSINRHMFTRDILYSKNNNDIEENTSDLDTNSFSVSIYQNDEALYEDVNYSIGNGDKSSDIIGFSWNGNRDELGDKIGCPVEYGKSCETVLIYLQNGISPRTRFVFSYTIEKAMTIYEDYAEINWKFAPYQNIIMNNVSVSVNLPENNFSDEEIYAFGHGGAETEFVEINNKTISARTDRLKVNQEIEMRIFFPSTIMEIDESRSNCISAKGYEYLMRQEQDILDAENIFINKVRVLSSVSILLFIIFLVLIGWCFYHVYTKYDKEHKSTFDNEYYRELPASYPPAMMGYLYRFKEITKDDLNATLMDLIRRKYIDVDYSNVTLTDKDADYTLIYNRSKDTSDLKEYERYLLKWYFDEIAHGDTLSMNQLEKHLKNESNAIRYNNMNAEWVKITKEDANKYDFFDKVEQKARKGFIVPISGGIISAVIFLVLMLFYGRQWPAYLAFVALVLSLSFSVYIGQIKRRSIQGNEDYVRWKAFEHFLKEFSHFEDYPVPGVEVWEHYLVYATAFGIADLVEKQLKTRFKDLGRESEYQSTPFLYYSYHSYFRHRMLHSFTVSSNTIRITNAKRMSSSSHSGGRGGFGGGSSHGGGGGGARSR